ncbi:MAG: DNA gyrase subunit A [Patescibacteria group bacterium]
MPDPITEATIETQIEEAETSPLIGTTTESRFGKIRHISIVEEMQKSYLDYAMSVIVSRALPDVRDGLKPVHRRILYSMYKSGIHHTGGYKKSARIVGDVLGRYHPHGDTAVYDALVRLAQDFSLRYPLIDGQGNFGSVDGDSAAAMRYTEARLDKIAQEILTDLDKQTVPFVDNFDGSTKEPAVMPSKLPNLLLMGAEGIAVGMATKIPPHHLGEVCQAILLMIEKGKANKEPLSETDQKLPFEKVEPQLLSGTFSSEATITDIMTKIKGPDFPTAGIIFDQKAIQEGYATGRGKIVVRGKAAIEESKQGFQIIITEIPYQVNKAKLVAKIADAVRDKKIIGIRDLRDESDRDGMRIAIDLKKDAQPKVVLNKLYKHTELQTSFAMNMVALNSEGTPQLMNIKQILMEFISHRQLVIVRRAQYELVALRDRAHILEGLLIALKNLDDVIETIRKSPDQEVARTRLMEKFALSEIQATAILEMQLKRLAALERKKIEEEYAQIQSSIKEHEVLLGNPDKILSVVKDETANLMVQYPDERRTKVIKGKAGEFSDEDLIAEESTIVTMTETGYIKRINPTAYRTQRRGGKGAIGMTTREEDTIKHLLFTNTHHFLLLFTNKGRVFKTRVYEIPESSRQAKGQAIVNLISLQGNEHVESLLTMQDEDTENKNITLVTKEGLVKRTKLELYKNIRTSGIIAITLKDADEVVAGKITANDDHLLLVSHEGKSIRFSQTEVKASNRDTQGVKGIMLHKNDYVVGAAAFPANIEAQQKAKKLYRQLVLVTEHGMGKRSEMSEYPLQKRSGQGVKVSEITSKTGKVAAAIMVDEHHEELVLTSKDGIALKLPLKNVPVLKRPTQGVILMRLKSGDKVAAVAITHKEEGEKLEIGIDEI